MDKTTTKPPRATKANGWRTGPRLFWLWFGRDYASLYWKGALGIVGRRDLMQPGEEGRLILTAFSAEFGIRPWYGYATPDGWAHVWLPWLWVRNDTAEIARRLAGGDE